MGEATDVSGLIGLLQPFEDELLVGGAPWTSHLGSLPGAAGRNCRRSVMCLSP